MVVIVLINQEMNQMTIKRFHADGYNMVFDTVTGNMMRWGNTLEEDPVMSPIGPEIADIEITSICEGPNGVPCKFCYKGNSRKGENMSLETFKDIFHKLPPSVTQIAFGVDSNGTSNSDMFKIMDYCREHEVVPNVTVANITPVMAYRLANTCGAVAVSRYENKGWCYDSVQYLTSMGLKQVNIHAMVCEENFWMLMETINDYHNDIRLKGMKAIVFLSLKQKARGEKFTRLSQDKFDFLVNYAMQKNVPIGFDSCSAPKFAKAVNYDKKLLPMIEPCESTCFSMYINQNGEYFPCSFTEKDRWPKGIDVTAEGFDFMRDVWHGEKTIEFRNKLLASQDDNGMRHCPLYKI